MNQVRHNLTELQKNFRQAGQSKSGNA